ncbi:MAG: virulence factor SrfB, partial [Desulfovibrio sp.]|nr:virulence factor SrfB [Desulfovibrio sp.]
FGRDVIDSSQESRNRRIQFIRQVAIPVALWILSSYEQADWTSGEAETLGYFGDCFKLAGQPFPLPNAEALHYVEEYVAKHGTTKDFSVLDVPLRIRPRLVDETIRAQIKDILANLCEVIHAYGCDALLLTGRPSNWKAISDTVAQLLPVAPASIIAMGHYRVGSWYPFADALGQVTDPKTTVVVGAILCALAEGQLEGFSFDPRNLTLHSTARYIGEMELNGQIKAAKVWFDVDVNAREEQIYEQKIVFAGPIAVGFRQLKVERWTTTRFYLLEFVSEDLRHKYAPVLPFTVTLALRVPGFEEETVERVEEVDEGEFSIVEVVDCNGDVVNKALEIRLQTLPRDEGFWLDTGIVYD